MMNTDECVPSVPEHSTAAEGIHAGTGGYRQSCTGGILLVLLAVVLSACQSSRNYSAINQDVVDDVSESIEQSQEQSREFREREREQVPAAVMESLVPGISLSSEAEEPAEERFDFRVNDSMAAREFFSLLTSGTDYSIIVHPDVSGQISSLELKNVTIAAALEQVASLYDYNVKRQGDVFQVLPRGMNTRIFHVDYLNVRRNGNSNMQITSTTIPQTGQGLGGMGAGIGGIGGVGGIGGGIGGVGGLGGYGGGLGGSGGAGGSGELNRLNTGGANIVTTNEADYWEGLQEIVASILGEVTGEEGNSVSDSGRSVVVSPHTGTVVVRAFPEELDRVAEFLTASQNALQRQVVLEAKILEVELKEAFQAGIDLSAVGTVNGGNNVSLDLEYQGENTSSLSSPLNIGYGARDFSGVIRLLETQGNVQVISSPRIATLNNQKAVFKVGEEEYFLTSSNTVSFGAGNDQTTNQNTTLQPFFSGIALDVTPQISADGDIILHIHPILSEVTENIKTVNEQDLPLANTSTRESDSIARARNGEVIVISGLMQTRSEGEDAAVPGVRDIPVAGELFEQRQNETVKTELVILLRALVDDDEGMQGLIDEHADNINRLRERLR